MYRFMAQMQPDKRPETIWPRELHTHKAIQNTGVSAPAAPPRLRLDRAFHCVDRLPSSLLPRGQTPCAFDGPCAVCSDWLCLFALSWLRRLSLCRNENQPHKRSMRAVPAAPTKRIVFGLNRQSIRGAGSKVCSLHIVRELLWRQLHSTPVGRPHTAGSLRLGGLLALRISRHTGNVHYSPPKIGPTSHFEIGDCPPPP